MLPDLSHSFDPRPRRKLSLWGRASLTGYPRTVSACVQPFLDAGFRLAELRELAEEGAEVPVPRVLALRLDKPAGVQPLPGGPAGA
jgi:hypothetical protein